MAPTAEALQGRLASVASYADSLERKYKAGKDKASKFIKDWSGQAALAVGGGVGYGWGATHTVKEWKNFTLHGGHVLAIGLTVMTRDAKNVQYRPAAHGALGALGAETYRMFGALLDSMGE